MNQPPKPHRRWRASREMQDRARELRHDMTPAEVKLWERLRNEQPDGLHFRRQHAIGTSIVDFCCAKSGLAIEVDGEIHIENREADKERDLRLKEQHGIQVLRFWNSEIVDQLDIVLDRIKLAVLEKRGGRE